MSLLSYRLRRIPNEVLNRAEVYYMLKSPRPLHTARCCCESIMAELDTGDPGEQEMLKNFTIYLRGPERPTTSVVKWQHILAVEKG